MEDREIVDLYWQRSEEAIPRTAAKFGGYCRTIAYNILSDAQDAEECVNDTWLKAWNSMPKNRPTVLAPYLGKLTRWISLTRLRERNSLKRGGGETALRWTSWRRRSPRRTTHSMSLRSRSSAPQYATFSKSWTRPRARSFSVATGTWRRSMRSRRNSALRRVRRPPCCTARGPSSCNT